MISCSCSFLLFTLIIYLFYIYFKYFFFFFLNRELGEFADAFFSFWWSLCFLLRCLFLFTGCCCCFLAKKFASVADSKLVLGHAWLPTYSVSGKKRNDFVVHGGTWWLVELPLDFCPSFRTKPPERRVRELQVLTFCVDYGTVVPSLKKTCCTFSYLRNQSAQQNAKLGTQSHA